MNYLNHCNILFGATHPYNKTNIFFKTERLQKQDYITLLFGNITNFNWFKVYTLVIDNIALITDAAAKEA